MRGWMSSSSEGRARSSRVHPRSSTDRAYSSGISSRSSGSPPNSGDKRTHSGHVHSNPGDKRIHSGDTLPCPCHARHLTSNTISSKPSLKLNSLNNVLMLFLEFPYNRLSPYLQLSRRSHPIRKSLFLR